jgi:hypothetical protein
MPTNSLGNSLLEVIEKKMKNQEIIPFSDRVSPHIGEH